MRPSSSFFFAGLVAMTMKHAKVYLVSALPHEIAHATGFQPFGNLNEALGHALVSVGRRATVAIIPEGSSVLAAVA